MILFELSLASSDCLRLRRGWYVTQRATVHAVKATYLCKTSNQSI